MPAALPDSPSFTNAGAREVEREVDAMLAQGKLVFDSASAESFVFTQWDGQRGTCQELMDAMLARVKEACSEPAAPDGGWVRLGETEGISREYHHARTSSSEGNGNRFFRYRGVLQNTTPELLCCALLEPHALGHIDHTLRHARVLHNFGDGRSRLVMVVAEAGPRPFFYDRDDCDLTCFYPPSLSGDGCWYQVSATVPSHLPSVSSAVRNHTMVWGYQFRPIIDPASGSVTGTQTTLISQTEIFGWIPKFSVNSMVSPILCEYLRKLERFTAGLPQEERTRLLQSYGLSRL